METWSQCEKGRCVSGGLCCGSNVVDSEYDDWLVILLASALRKSMDASQYFCSADGRIPGVEKIVHQFLWLGAIVHHLVDLRNETFQLVLRKYELSEVPILNRRFVGFERETGDNTKIMTRSFKGPE